MDELDFGHKFHDFEYLGVGFFLSYPLISLSTEGHHHKKCRKPSTSCFEKKEKKDNSFSTTTYLHATWNIF